MSERVNIGGFMASVITLAFMFSTMYALAFFYFQASGQTPYGQPLGTGDVVVGVDRPLIDIFGIFDAILNFVSLLSPFVFVKMFIEALMITNTPLLYQVVDLLVLRPIGWICAGMTVNYIISKIPTESNEG